jgi:DNA uptake protein ComE-like DNA-binding protein
MRPRRGFATLIVLWVVAVAAVVLVSVQRASLGEAVAGREAMARVRAYWAARSGLEAALARAEYSALRGDPGGPRGYLQELALAAEGRLEGAAYQVGYDTPFGRSLGPRDAHAMINVNMMSREALLTLPGMTEDMAESILDWIDADDDTRPLGAEVGYYRARAYSYEPRNAPVRSVEELELIAGVDPLLVRGEDWNLNGILDPNEDDGDASWPPDNADGQLDAGWSAIITAVSVGDNLAASGQPRLDLSTASAGDVASRTGITLEQAAVLTDYAQKRSDIARMRDLVRFELRQLADLAAGGQLQGGRVTVPQGQQRSNTPPLTTEELARVLDEVTIGTETGGAAVVPGKLNINTCPAETLQYLPNIDPALADAIIFERESRPDGFSSVVDLLAIPGLSRARLATLYDMLTVRSNTFIVTSRGRDLRTGVEAEITATVDRSRIPAVLQEVIVR